MKLYIKTLINIIDNIILLGEHDKDNTIVLCGIKNNIIDTLITDYGYLLLKDYLDCSIIRKTKNGVLINYQGNHIILQRNGVINKPLKEFEFLYLEELDDDL
jgi:hypothetical protein